MRKRNKENVFRSKVNWRKELTLLPGYLILTIWVAFTAAFLIWILGASLSTSREIFTGTVFKFESGVHFENYASAWKGNNVSVYFANSLLYAVSSCIVVILISAPAAYVLSRFTFLGNKGVKTGLILAMSIPEVMIIMPIYSLTAQYHIRGRILLIILYILLRVPFTTTYLLNFFASLSRSYEEAAAIDGCSPEGTFFRIILPLLKPVIVTVTILNGMWIWNDYLLPSLMLGQNGKVKTLPVAVQAFVGSYVKQWDLILTAALLAMIPMIIVFLLAQKQIMNGMVEGAIK